MGAAGPEPGAPIERLDEPGWGAVAAGLLASLGFRLIDGLGAPGAASRLLVAFRDAPTLDHFDPELLSFYAPLGDGGVLQALDLESVQRLARTGAGPIPVLWGHVHVVDRVPVENRFLTFGGELRVASAGDGLTVAQLRSPVPMVRWGGHSQATDPLADAIGAFFGRLIVPVDFTPGAAARIDAVRPEVLFLAFLEDAAARGRLAQRRGAEPGLIDRWLGRRWREARDDAAGRAQAERLLRDLAINRDITATNGPRAEAERPA